MSRQILVTPRADDDLTRHFNFIANDSIEAAIRLGIAVDETYQMLAEHPGMGTLCEELSSPWTVLRRFPIKRFPNHVVYYRPMEKGIEVMRLLHGAQDRPRQFD